MERTENRFCRRYTLKQKGRSETDLFFNGALLLCDYRTKNYEEYKPLEYKIELLLNQIENIDADNILINC